MRDEQHPNQDEANIPDQNKQTDSLEESLREYQERKRQEFQLNISGLDDIGDESPEIYSKKSEYDVEPHMAEEIESHSHNTPKKESQASQQNLKAQTMTKEQKKKMKKRDRKNKRIFFWMWIVMILVVSFSIARFAMVNINDMLAVGRDDSVVQIQIPKNATGEQVGELLAKSGIISKPSFFALYSKITKSEGHYQYGTYEIKKNMDYEAIINHIQSNANRLDNETTQVTITEGMSVRQIAQLLEEKNICTVDEVLEAANDSDYFDIYSAINSITNDKDRYYLLEGYLFPDTYDFYTGENPTDALSKLLNNYKDKITQEMKDKAASMNMTMDQVITLASMIQAEAANVDDMYMISSIFHNRLRDGAEKGVATLDSDPTVWYPYHSREEVPADQVDSFKSRYNTYEVQGLPPGPICNPGLDAINAALNPKTTDYYYFCHKDGQAYYSKTLEEHQQKLQELGLS
jgi:hypothetical protein